MPEVFKPELCPDAKRMGDLDYCEQNDRVCELELGHRCAEYQDFLKERDEEGIGFYASYGEEIRDV